MVYSYYMRFIIGLLVVLCGLVWGGVYYVESKPITEHIKTATEVAAQYADPGSILSILPDLAGFKGERVYLLLLQNSHELRPTGGFIGNFGIVRVKDGQILDTQFEGSEYLDARIPKGTLVPRSPKPIATYMEQGYMYFRDGNWNPDFKETAQTLVQLYAQSRGDYADKIDGVIAVNTDVASEIMKIVGPITVSGVTFTSDNIIDRLQYEVEIAWLNKAISKHERKAIVDELFDAIKDRLSSMSFEQLYALVLRMEALAKEKHIIGFDFREQVQSVYEGLGYAGLMRYTNSDFIGVVDTNLGGFKTDRVMERVWQYAVSTRDANTLRSELRLRYKNPGVKDYRTRDYRSYTRIYLPLGVNNVSVVGGSVFNENLKRGFDVYEEGNFTVVGFFHVDKLQSENEYVITYQQPESVFSQYSRGLYELHVWKQPGMHSPTLTVTHSFDRPVVDDTTTSPFQTPLTIDRDVTLRTLLQ